ncbi:MAG: cytochrome c family protein [bacterium]|uniref:Cytochrome c family protein n=1 Tax=Candidatus Methylomirabilis tolerans TaxID=3123416 RepID=A0AAJ1AK20_9BACT|nr:cytochrome c family protein [Candidatus Methylomirabilis sp.]
MKRLILYSVVVGACLGLSVGTWAMNDPPSAADDDAQLEFLAHHWQEPIPPQGKPPAHFSSIEASLDPENCAVCHRTQYEDWSSSLHSKSMGPGVIGQTMELIHNDPKTALLCYSCHAPLAEQQEKVLKKDAPPSKFKRKRHFSVTPPDAPGIWGNAAQQFKTHRAFSASLQQKGLSCAGCHVRGHQRFGPPKRDGSLENSLPAVQLPHGGAVRTAAFERAEFCKGCHQFEPNGAALDGKLLENTYNEWKEGPYAREGKTCQSCHMPERRHLWRGIHNAETVKQGVSVRFSLDKERYRIGEQVHAEISLVNTGVGHNFPTYVTPKIVVRWELVDADGTQVNESVQEERIGREVTLDLTQELFDTRIAPGQSRTVRYVRTIDRIGLTLRASVIVIPDDFYIRFYDAVLPNVKVKEVRVLLEQAIREGRARSFPLFTKDIAVS